MADRLGGSKNVFTHSLEKNTTTRKKKHQTKYKLPPKNLEGFQKQLWREYVVKPYEQETSNKLHKKFYATVRKKGWEGYECDSHHLTVTANTVRVQTLRYSLQRV